MALLKLGFLLWNSVGRLLSVEVPQDLSPPLNLGLLGFLLIFMVFIDGLWTL